MIDAIEKAMARFHPKSSVPRSPEHTFPFRGNALPRLWLVTDERTGDDKLMAALHRLPPGSGVLFRHYSLGHAQRLTLFERVKAIARKRRLLLLTGGKTALRGADGVHCPGWERCRMRRAPAGKRKLLLSFPVHNRRDLAKAQGTGARRAGADIIFLSPVFPTRSHPGEPATGPVRFGLLARNLPVAVIAMGGMTRKRFRRIHPLGAYGWAAIDALTR